MLLISLISFNPVQKASSSEILLSTLKDWTIGFIKTLQIQDFLPNYNKHVN